MKRIFVSFAIEDRDTKVLFTGQAKNTLVPYEFVDMSVKSPWDSQWKTNCRIRIRGCHGVIVLVSKNLKNADGALWEVRCAIEENKPILGVYVGGASLYDKPFDLYGISCVDWTWDSVRYFINSLA